MVIATSASTTSLERLKNCLNIRNHPHQVRDEQRVRLAVLGVRNAQNAASQVNLLAPQLTTLVALQARVEHQIQIIPLPLAQLVDCRLSRPTSTNAPATLVATLMDAAKHPATQDAPV